MLGSAEVIIRAITTALKKDIKDGLDDAAKDLDKDGSAAGKAWAAHFGDAVEDELGGELGDKISLSIEEAYNKGRGDRDGKSLSRKLFSGFLTGMSGAFSAVASLTSMFAIVVGLTGVIGGLVGALGALASGLVAVVAAATPALAALGVVGVAGIGALVQAVGVGIGIFAQLKGELSELGPEARNVREEFDGLKEVFGDAFKSAGEAFVFPQLASAINTLTNTLFPVLKGGIDDTAKAFGAIIEQADKLMQSSAFRGDLGVVLKDNATLLKSFGTAAVTLGGALTSVLAAASPLINRFASWITVWADNIAGAAEMGQESGRLSAFFDRAGDVAAQLGDILKNLSGVIRDVFQAAAPLGAIFLRNFQIATAALNMFLDTANGSGGLAKFFAPGGQLHQNISATWGLVKQLGKSLADLSQSEGIETLARGLTQALPAIEQALDGAIIAVGEFASALGTGLASAAGQQGVQVLRQGIIDLGDAFAELEPAVGPLLEIIGDLASNLANFLGPAFKAIANILPELVGPLDEVGSAIGEVLLAAVQALAPLLPPLARIIADLAQILAGPLSGALTAVGAVLRVFVGILELLMPVVTALSPAITALAIAIGALKIASLAAGWIGALRVGMAGLLPGLAGAGTNGTAAAGGLGLFGRTATTAAAGAGLLTRGATGLVNALGGPVGIAIAATAVLVTEFASAQNSAAETQDSYTQALLKGGEAAASAQRAYEESASKQPAFLRALDEFTGFAASMDDAKQAADDYTAGLAPLERAQFDVAKATEELTFAQTNSSSTSRDVAVAERDLRSARQSLAYETERSAIAQGDYATAMRVGNEAALASILPEVAASNAKIQSTVSTTALTDAATRLADLRASGTATTEQIAAAELNLQQSLNNSVTSYANQALAMGQVLLASGEVSDASDAFNIALGRQIAALDGLIATTEGPAKQALMDLRQQLLDIDGFDPHVAVQLEIELAKAHATEIQDKFRQIEHEELKVPVGVEDNATGPLGTILDDVLNLDGQTPTPTADLNTDPFNIGLTQALIGADNLDGQTPTPTASLNPAPFNGLYNSVMGSVNTLAGQRPTPVAGMNTSPLSSAFAGAIASTTTLNGQRPTPVATLVDQVSGPARNAQAAINAIQSKTVVITTILRTQKEGQAATTGGGGAFAASGGLINSDEWTTVGEEGREMVFLNQGMYVATYQKAQRILQAMQVQTRGIASTTAGFGSERALALATSGRSIAGTNIPITVFPAPGMNETELARKTGFEVARTLRKV